MALDDPEYCANLDCWQNYKHEPHCMIVGTTWTKAQECKEWKR